MQNKIAFSKTALFLSLSFIAGIFFAPVNIFLGLLLIFCFCLFIRNRTVAVFCLVFFLAGSLYFLGSLNKIPRKLDSPIIAEVVEEPSYKQNSVRIIAKHSKGKVLLYGNSLVSYKQGDILVVEGEFQKPTPLEYANYLKKEGIYHISFYPEIEKVGRKGSFLRDRMSSLRSNFKEKIRNTFPAPHSFLLEAVLLGDRSSFSDDFNEKLSVSGTRHLTAISGMHIIIISSLLFYSFSLLGISKRNASLLSILFISIFVIFVGAPASAVRAGVMGGTLLLSYVFFRETNSVRLIVFAGLLMLLFNPFLLHFDTGFQLSFLAVTGIIYLHRPVKRFLITDSFFKRNEKLTDLLAVTIGAQIAVFPLILYNFGHIPLFSIFTNILLVPLLPFIMVLGFLASVTGVAVFSFPAYFLLSFVIWVIEEVSLIPFAAVYIEGVPAQFILFLYLVMVYKLVQDVKGLNILTF